MLPVRAGACRHLLAMSVAQPEAVLATADAGPAALKDESVAALVLFKALEHGPPALASSAPVQQAMERLLASVEALGVSLPRDAALQSSAQLAGRRLLADSPGLLLMGSWAAAQSMPLLSAGTGQCGSCCPGVGRNAGAETENATRAAAG